MTSKGQFSCSRLRPWRRNFSDDRAGLWANNAIDQSRQPARSHESSYATKIGSGGLAQGGDARCSTQPERRPDQHRFVLLGAPGVGKGTQAELLSERFHICPLSTGDIFRASKALAAGCECSPAMLRALGYMNTGELVPDETVLSLIRQRAKCLRCGGGFLLDGFPRTIAQAEALENILEENEVKLDAVLSYDLPLEQIVVRLGGRRICPQCKRVFHAESRPPRQAGICDDCDIALFLRDDDRPEAIRVRMHAYEKNTTPVIDFYRARDLLIPIEAGSNPAETFERTLKAIQKAATRDLP